MPVQDDALDAELAASSLRQTEYSCDDYVKRKTGKARLYRGMRGLDLACCVQAADAGDNAGSARGSRLSPGGDSGRGSRLGSIGGDSSSAPRASRHGSISGKRRSKMSTRSSFGREGVDNARVLQAKRARDILRTCAFFVSADASKPGLINSLAKTVTFFKSEKGSILFRQDDPPKSCYVVVSGRVGILIKQKPPKPVVEDDEEDAEIQQAPSSARLPHGKNRDGVVRYQTIEQCSSYSEDSHFGKMVAVLPGGTVIGERALQDDSLRAATVKVVEDVEWMLIQGDDYNRIVKGCLDRLKFFDRHLPGAQDWANQVACGVLKTHPACFFREETFKPGYKFLMEGIYSQPVIFLIRQGTVEFRRTAQARDQRAWRLGRVPLVERGSSLLSPAGSKSAPQLIPLSEHVRQQLVPGDRSQIFADTLSEGQAFCSMSAVPMPGYEPFTVVATTQCTVFIAGESGILKMPDTDLGKLRYTLMAAASRRIKGFEVKHPEQFQPHLRAVTPPHPSQQRIEQDPFPGLLQSLGLAGSDFGDPLSMPRIGDGRYLDLEGSDGCSLTSDHLHHSTSRLSAKSPSMRSEPKPLPKTPKVPAPRVEKPCPSSGWKLFK